MNREQRKERKKDLREWIKTKDEMISVLQQAVKYVEVRVTACERRILDEKMNISRHRQKALEAPGTIVRLEATRAKYVEELEQLNEKQSPVKLQDAKLRAIGLFGKPLFQEAVTRILVDLTIGEVTAGDAMERMDGIEEQLKAAGCK